MGACRISMVRMDTVGKHFPKKRETLFALLQPPLIPQAKVPSEPPLSESEFTRL